jgi:hypothetical protein
MFSCSQKFFAVPQKSPPLMGWIGEVLCEENGNCVIAILRDESAINSRTGCVVRLPLHAVMKFDTPKEAIRHLKLNNRRKD